MKYIVTDSLGNPMHEFYNSEQAYNYKYTYGNSSWRIKVSW